MVRDDSHAMSDVDPARKIAVGKQLRRLRDRRPGLTQVKLGVLVGIRDKTVSAIETGRNTIQSGRRSLWEEVFGLVPGTITAAYETGSPLELLPEPATAAEADLPDLLSTRVAKLTEKSTASDDRLDRLTARMERVEEHLDEERRIRRSLERRVTELARIVSADRPDK